MGIVDISATIQEEYDLAKKQIGEAINVSLEQGNIGGEVQLPKPFQVAAPPHTGRKKIAYAITVTKDGAFLDGALVLGYGVMKLHHKDGQTGNEYWDKLRLHELGARLKSQAGSAEGFTPELSEYDADLVAFVTPAITHAKHILERYGWKVIVKDLPVGLDEIENKEYVEKMKASGCCGADEFLKLWAYTLTDYHRVVHLDMDSVVYNSMDPLFTIDKELLWTGDYNMQGKSPVPPVQGGFLVIRPSMDTFHEYQGIIRKGDHSGGKGWGGTKIGNFWGGQTIQGIMPYFYYAFHRNNSLEVNRCVYNCMVDNPYRPSRQPNPPKICLDGNDECQDCREQEINQVRSAHFTICQKPWTCNYHDNPRNMRLCSQLHKRWFELRDEYERVVLGVDTATVYGGNTNLRKNKLVYNGFCTKYGDKGYIRIPVNIND